jgi:hypothetical protein
MEVRDQLHVAAALRPGKKPPYPLNKRLAGPHRRSVRGGKEKIIYVPAGNQTLVIQPVAQLLFRVTLALI